MRHRTPKLTCKGIIIRAPGEARRNPKLPCQVQRSLGRNASETQWRFVRPERPVTTQRRRRTLVRPCFACPSRNPNYTFSTK
jgi:hypothetical protein